MYVCMYVCMCVCVYVCMSVCLYVCMYVCVKMIDSEVVEVIEGIDSWSELRTNGNSNYEEQKRPVASKKRYCMNIETQSRQIIHVTINEKKMIAKYFQAENALQMNQKKTCRLDKTYIPLGEP